MTTVGKYSLLEGVSPVIARQLTTSPTLALAQSYPTTSDEFAVEHVNLVIRKLCLQILLEVEQKARKYSERLRQQLTEG